MRIAEVFVNKVKAGELVELDNREFEFRYNSDYLLLPDAKPVSLTLPLCNSAFQSGNLFPFFSNLITEGEVRQLQSRILKIDEADQMSLLVATADEDTVGNVTVKLKL